MGAAAPVRDDLVAALGVEIDPQLLETALTHRSYAYEHGTGDNERFEFLGDSVLQRAVTMMLFSRYPDDDEGELAKRRAGLVSTVALASIARTLQLGSHLLLGRGEVLTRGAEKPSILADAVEAIIGAAFLSIGSEQSEALVLRLVQPLVDDPASTGAITDPKTALQELASIRHAPPPVYVVTGDGPEHARIFTATVTVGDLVVSTGTGTSKKQAEVAAAWEAYRALHA